MTSNALKSYRKLAFIFFGIFGLIHIGTALLLSNKIFPEASNLINKIFDIPFALITLIYAILSLEFSEKTLNSKLTFIISLLSIILLLIFLLYINFIIPDRLY